MGLPRELMVKTPHANVGDVDPIPGLEWSPGGGNGNPLQLSCLENPMDSEAWWATVHGSQKVRHDWATEHTAHLCNYKFLTTFPGLTVAMKLHLTWSLQGCFLELCSKWDSLSYQYQYETIFWVLGSPWNYLSFISGQGLDQTFCFLDSFVAIVQLLSCVHFFGKLIDCSLPVSSVHGIFQTRILEWAAIPFSRRSFWLKAPTHVSCIGSRVLYHWASMELGLGNSFLILLQNWSRFWYAGSFTVDLSETQSLVLENGNTCDTIDPLRIRECSQTDFSILKHFIIQRLWLESCQWLQIWCYFTDWKKGLRVI